MTTADASPAYVATLTRHEEVAYGTMAFRFEKPAGFTFRLGCASRTM
jgi:hypothetical protein